MGVTATFAAFIALPVATLLASWHFVLAKAMWPRTCKRVVCMIQSHERLAKTAVLVILLVTATHMLNSYSRTDTPAAITQRRGQVCPEAGRHVCTLTKAPQFSRFLYFIVDGMATDEAEQGGLWENFGKTGLSWYRVWNGNYKNSMAVYSSFFTGKIPTNFAGKTLEGDSLMAQLHRVGIVLNFSGEEVPTTRLVPEEYIHTTDLYTDTDGMWAPLLGRLSDSTRTQEEVDKGLDYFVADGASVVFATNYLDHFNHKYTKYGEPTRNLCERVAHDLGILIKDWIDRHPDYLLVLMSDHGGDAYPGESAVMIHGTPDQGNEPFIAFYNPTIETMSEGQWIDLEDACATTTQYLRDVNIPFESIGRLWPMTADPEDALRLHTQNTLQLQALAQANGFELDEEELHEARRLISTNPQEAITHMVAFINAAKQSLFFHQGYPVWELLIFGAMVSVLLVVPLLHNLSSLGVFVTQLQRAFLQVLFPVFMIFFTLGFIWWDPQSVFVGYEQILLVLAIQALVEAKTPRNGTTIDLGDGKDLDEDESESEGDLTKPVEPFAAAVPLVHAALLVFLAHATTWIAVNVRDYISGHPLFAPLMYALAVVLLLVELRLHKRALDGPKKMESVMGVVRICFYGVLLVLVAIYEMTQIALFIRLGYFLSLLDVLIILLSPVFTQRHLVLPISYNLFILSNAGTRLFLLTILLPSFHKLASALGPQKTTRSPSGTLDTRKWVLAFLAINHAFWAWFYMENLFDLNVDINVPGIDNPEGEAEFAGFMFGVRKLGFFFLLVGFLLRMGTPLESAWGQGRSVAPTRTYLWAILLLHAFMMVWVFYKNYIELRFLTDTFLYASILLTSSIFMGAALVFEGIGSPLCARVPLGFMERLSALI